MKTNSTLFAFVAFAVLATSASAGDSTKLIDQLSSFGPFVGKTWKGDFADSTPEDPKYDVARWEVALKGHAVRILHSVNGGQYGGETLVVWDGSRKEVVFFYFTTAGFHTQGTFRFEGARFVSHESVTGNEDGITEVKSTGEILPGGEFRVRSSYSKDGQWTEGHAVVYKEAPQAKVVLD